MKLLDVFYPGPRGFSWFFFAKEIKSKPRSGDNESRKRRVEREKPLVTLANNLPYPAPLAIFSFFYPLSVKLKCSEIQQNWSVTIQALKINQGTKFGTLKKPMFSLFDVIIFWFNGKIKQRARLPLSNISNNRIPRIIAFPVKHQG